MVVLILLWLVMVKCLLTVVVIEKNMSANQVVLDRASCLPSGFCFSVSTRDTGRAGHHK